MSTIAVRLHRLVLLAYPAQFRREFGAEMAALAVDRHRDEPCSEWRILLQETVDAAQAAPRLRWESPMTRIVVIAVVGTAAIAAILVTQLVLIPLALMGLAAWFAWGRPRRPIAPATPPRRWATWLLAGGAAIASAIAIPAIDGGELDEPWWALMVLALLAGIGMAITGALLAVKGRPAG